MLKFFRENSDKLFLLGIAFVLLGTAVFLGATPRGRNLNNPGEAWMLAFPLVASGASLLILHWRLNR
jgi:hypothetical protein